MRSMKTILHSAAIFSMLISLHGAEIKDPIDIAMDAAMERNGSTAGMCEAIADKSLTLPPSMSVARKMIEFWYEKNGADVRDLLGK